MKKIWKQKIVWLAAAALLLVGSISLPKVMAYFTTYASAGGGVEINISNTTNEVEEKVDGLIKEIRLENTSAQEEYVRVKVFCGSEFSLTYTNESGKWSQGEGDYWYYSDIVKPGEITEPLLAAITVPEGHKDNFDVIVVEESVPVLYAEDGSTYADWTMKADSEVVGEGAE